MRRRDVLKWVGGGSVALVGGRYLFLPPAPSTTLQSVDELAVQLVDSLDADERRTAVVDYDHPLRQYHNRGVNAGGIAARKLSWEQRGLVTDLLHAGLSGNGRSRIPEEFFLDLPGIQLVNLLVCGNPRRPPYQLIMTAPHLNLRLGGKSREGVAFGGPQVYGDQRGDGKPGLPGNVYRYQLALAQQLFTSLSAQQQQQALVARAPIQTQIELQGPEGIFPGIPVQQLAAEQRRAVRELIDAILSTYAHEDAAYAWQCLDHNGGIESLSLAYYRDGEIENSGQYQIFRLEGPAAVFYFRGAPHLHAFINVAMDPAPLSVGELLTHNEAPLADVAVKQLFERSLAAHAGSEHAFYPAGSVVGRLRAGPVRSGDIYNLESWQEAVILAEIRGSELRVPLDFKPDPARTYEVATTRYGLERLGRVARWRRYDTLLRDATIAYVRQHGTA